MPNLHTLEALLLQGLSSRFPGAVTFDAASGRLSGDGWYADIRRDSASQPVTFSDSGHHQPGVDGLVSEILKAAGHPVCRPNPDMLLTEINRQFFTITFRHSTP